MAASQGYQCEFIDFVSEDLYCKKCALVARRLTVAMCCGESFCHGCLVDSSSPHKPCPACGHKDFTTFEQMKSQKRINSLPVYCSMKERGCGWCGPLEQLDTHVDPHQDNCQYVDTKCPLNCDKAVPKNKMEQHVAKECVRRVFTCQHCNFKATYEEVVGTHLAECSYVPLQCPNRCGVTCEREVMEDHMKMCRLEEVGCEFSGVGCDDRFRREDQEEHHRENSHKHLTMTASVAMETKEQLQLRTEELQEKIEEGENKDLKHTETEEALKHLIEEQKKKLKEQEKKLIDQEKKMIAQEKKLINQEKKMIAQEKTTKEQEKKLTEQEDERKVEQQKLKQVMEDLNKLQKHEDEHKQLIEQQNSKLLKLEQFLHERVSAISVYSNEYHLQKFEMKNFSQLKAKGEVWKSPVMYSHLIGYKFCIEVEPNESKFLGINYMGVNLWVLVGEFDDQLKWPASVAFTIALINQHGGENKERSPHNWQMSKPSGEGHRTGTLISVKHSDINNFLKNDSLYIHLSKFTFN